MDGNSALGELDSKAYVQQRQRMVQGQLYARGIRDRAVLKAFGRVPRHCFVPEKVRPQAYADHPLPIGTGQTISQPYVVAYMLQALQLTTTDIILEIGAGSGYQTALLAELVKKVYTIEFFPELATTARQVLNDLNYTNIELQTADGTLGWSEMGPFNAIIGSAAAAEIPPALVEQLGVDGRLILPVGVDHQHLILVVRTSAGVQRKSLLPVRFVPMQEGTP